MVKSYFVEERRKAIIELLQKEKRVKVKDLATLFSVTEDLIRKDFAILEKKGLLQRTYGGAILKAKMAELLPYKERQKKLAGNKGLAECAVELIENGDTLFIEASMSTYPIFSLLKEKRDLTIVTNAIHHITEMLPDATLIQTGGFIHKEDEATYGKFAIDCVRSMSFDKCFLSTSGVTKDLMLTCPIEESLMLKQNVMKQSKEINVMVAWEKWERQSIYHFSSLKTINTVITDTNDVFILERLNDLGIHVKTSN